MAFHWNWFSQVGSTRRQNQDFAGIAIRGDRLIAVIADGVFSREGSGDFAHQFVRCVIDRAVEAEPMPSGEEVADWVEVVFHQLKKSRAPKTSTSFLAAGFLKNQLMFAVHAGDCRIGVIGGTDGPLWKTAVHSLANATKPLSESELIAHPWRNQLTRAFNSKRFCIPDVAELNCECADGVALVTDGFWAGLPTDVQRSNFAGPWKHPAECEDDVSRLFIKWQLGNPERSGASENLYLRLFNSDGGNG